MNLKKLVIIGVGSNIGNTEQNLRLAIKKLPLNYKKVAPFYKNDALLPKNHKKSWDLEFLNTIVVGYAKFDLLATFSLIKKIEKQLGRQKTQKWAPRTIDLDILFWQNRLISLNLLSIPHKEVAKRNFVLNPLNWISQFIMHPKYCISARQMLKNYVKNYEQN